MLFRSKDVLLSNMDAELMMGYETYLKAQGASMNTVSFYMRILRATYNRAVDKGVIRQRFPFKHVYTGVEKTVKRAISFKVIRQLKEMDLSHSQSMEFARDMFMFSFYTRGMSFVDMAFLKKTDLNNGMLTYRRKKTGQLLSIRWEKCMQDIVDKYPGNYSTYLLPIIIHIRKDERLQYKNSICLVNRRLKEIGKKLGLVHPLTMYVARHSWASVARGKHIPLSVISEGMGHDSEKTTLIYLAALDTTVIDKAIFIDRHNQNITTLERKERGYWLIRSMNPATTGQHRPPYAQETPLGMFVLQEKKTKMIFLKDGSAATGGFAPYASRFNNGGYIHGVPTNAPATGIIEYSYTLGTIPRSHMCVRNATSHAKFIFEWAPVNETIIFVLE